jgi:ArsR family transcriptional regulator, arsenate/arsenite/antimonite-responsive transcriptional repressor
MARLRTPAAQAFTLRAMSEAREVSAITRPLPLVGDGKPIATPHIVNEPRNVTVDVFRALADPIRLELLALIAANGPICVCHLEEALRYKQPRISKHLGTLRRAGLVRSRREGTWVYYELNEEMLELATSFIDQVQLSARAPHEADLCAEPK